MPHRVVRRAVPAAAGLALGVSLAVSAWGGAGDRTRPQPSVRRLDLPAAAPAPPAPAGQPSPDRSAAPPAEPTGPAAAVEAFLAALAAGRPEDAWPLLATTDRAAYGSAAAWRAAQADRPAITGFRTVAEVTAAGGAEVTTDLVQRPALDPFVGLVPGRARVTWRAVDEGGRWRVAADPLGSEALLPPDAGGADTARAWVSALAACDRAAAAALEVAAGLVGPVLLADAPCRDRGRWTVGEPRPIGSADAAAAAPLVDTYGGEVAGWARLVPAAGPTRRVLVALAPVGEEWKVAGVLPAAGGGG